MKQKVITVIGGTGFLGRYIVKSLAGAGYTIRVISRHPESALHLKTAGDVGQVVLMGGNLSNPDSLFGKLDGSYAVINLVGVLYEGGRQRFGTLHTQGAEKLAQMAKSCGAERFIQISALGADKNTSSSYARTKLAGEKAVQTAFPDATILRPSIVFGPEDNFYNQFARMAAFAPALPLIGGGHTCFQPVYVMDIARAILACLAKAETKGQTYELAGPQTYSFKQILQYILSITGKKRCLLKLPFGIASVIGTFGELLPVPPLTRDQVRLLKYNNVASADMPGFAQLGITPTAVEMVVPEYLARYRSPNTSSPAVPA
jgi:NADH dehydrogenase